MKSVLIIIIFSILFIFSYCDWDSLNHVGYRKPDARIIEYFDFKPNSTWTYQDDSSKTTMTITLTERTTYDIVSGESSSWTYHNEGIKSSFDNNEGINGQIIGSFDTHVGAYQGFKYKLYLLAKTNGSTYYVSLNISKDSFVSLNVSGKTYNNLLYYKSEAMYYNDNYYNIDTSKKFINEYWISSRNWIVKMIERTPSGNKYWSLRDFKITK